MFFSKSVQYAFLGGFIILQAAVFSTGAFAQNAADAAAAVPPIDILPAEKAQERGVSYDSQSHTHPAIKMTPDKSELVRLDADAASIIIGNPNHLGILADSAQTLVLVPRAPGATHFVVLGQDGSVIMQRHVIIASPKEQYMRIRRSCAGSDDDSCQSTSVFYCPDMCHEIILGQGGSADAADGVNENTKMPADADTADPGGETPPPDTTAE